MSCYLRPGRHSSAERPVQREDGPAAVLAITGMQFNDVMGMSCGLRARSKRRRSRVTRTWWARAYEQDTRGRRLRQVRSHLGCTEPVCDGWIADADTGLSANPGLTIQALAARTADYLISQQEVIFANGRRDMTEPPCRRSLAPPGPLRGGFHTFVDLAQQLFRAAMAMIEEALDHFAHCKTVCEMSKRAERKLIFDGVDEQRAMLARLL